MNKDYQAQIKKTANSPGFIPYRSAHRVRRLESGGREIDPDYSLPRIGSGTDGLVACGFGCGFGGGAEEESGHLIGRETDCGFAPPFASGNREGSRVGVDGKAGVIPVTDLDDLAPETHRLGINLALRVHGMELPMDGRESLGILLPKLLTDRDHPHVADGVGNQAHRGTYLSGPRKVRLDRFPILFASVAFSTVQSTL